MNKNRSFGSPFRVFAAGAAHVDRRGRSAIPFVAGASNPGVLQEAPGGAMFNAVRALRRLGAEVTLVTARGGDADGRRVAEALAALDVSDLALTWLDRRTPTYTALLDENGDLVGGLADMALYDLMQPRVFRRRHWRLALEDCDALLLDANLPAGSLRALAETAGPRPVTAVGVSPAKAPRLKGALAFLSAVFLSKAEAVALAGADSGDPALVVARRLLSLGCRRAVITDGPRPALIFNGEILVRQQPASVGALRDVTGAGDTLAAVASYAFASGMDFIQAARHGMAAASLHIAADRDETGANWREIQDCAADMASPASFPSEDESEIP